MKLKRLLTCLLVPVLILSMVLGSALAEETAPVPEGERSMLGKLYDSLDPVNGFHISYTVKMLGYTSVYDFQAKALQSYERMYLEEFGSLDSDTIRIYTDDKLYTVKNSDMSGFYMDVPVQPEYGAQFDTVFASMYNRAQETVYETIEYEIDGVVYTAEKYPALTEYGIDQIFCFDEAGNLVYLVNCASEALGLGEYVYAITLMDGTVDETLFDISGYTIQDYQTVLQEAMEQLDALNAG